MPITFSFLPFCTRVSVHARRRLRGGHIRYTYFLRTRRYVTVHTLLSRSTYMRFFSQTPYDPRLYNSNLGSFLSRIIGYTLFCALVARGKGQRSEAGMARGRFGIFPSRKEKEFCRRPGNFISTSNLLDKRERYEVINFSPSSLLPYSFPIQLE